MKLGLKGLVLFYENYTNVKNLYNVLSREIATSVRLIVSGTGLTAERLNSEAEVRKYRLLPWTYNDLDAVIEKRFKDLTKTVLQFMKNEPILFALISNARSAWFLLEELKSLDIEYRRYTAEGTTEQVLNRQSSKVVSNVLKAVAEKYITANAFNDANNRRRRQVAALVFSVVERSVQEENPTEPNFLTRHTDDARLARALVNFNMEYRDGNLIYVEGVTQQSVTVSPAITLLLYYMLGAFTENLTGWQGQEMLAALRAFRLIAIENCLDDTVMQNVRLVSLIKRVPEPTATKNFEIPIFNAPTVWINGNTSPFADVIAPFCLYQCKFTNIGDKVDFDVIKELGKCGLLKVDYDNSKRARYSRAVLAVLMKTWKKEIPFPPPHDDNTENQMNGLCQGHYPEILIKSTSRLTDNDKQFIAFKYDEKHDEVTLRNDEEIRTTDDFDDAVQYVISTNTKKLVLTYMTADSKKTLIVTPDSVDKEGKFLRSVKDQPEYEEIMSFLRTNVEIRCIFW